MVEKKANTPTQLPIKTDEELKQEM